MSPKSPLDQLRKQAYVAYHQDGLIDMLIGLGIIGFALSLTDSGTAFLALSWLPILFYIPLKNRITVPRFGYVQFDSQQKTRSLLVLLLGMGSLSLLFLLGLFFALRFDTLPQAVIEWLHRYDMLVFGLFGAIILVSGALWTGLNRLYSYAALALVLITAGILLDLHVVLYLTALGLIPLLVGIALLMRFLNAYPPAEAMDAGNDRR